MARKINAKDLVNDIQSGVDDNALMQKYDLSGQELQRLFGQLLEKGLVTESDLSSRSLKATEAVVDTSLQETSEPSPPQVTPEQSKSENVTHHGLFGDWCESKRTLILLLIFATPIGLYGLNKTSLFSKKTKAWVAILTVVLAIAAIKPALRLWVMGVGGIGAYALYQLLPFGRAARIAVSIIAGMMVIGMIFSVIEKDSVKSGTVPAKPVVEPQPAPQPVHPKNALAAQPAQPNPVSSTPQPASDAKAARDCEKRCSDKAMSEDDPVSAFEACITTCPESVQRNHRCVMGCSDKCGVMKDLHRRSGEDWDSFQARVKVAGKEIPKCINKCAADCNKEHYGE